ncbi:nitrilase family protein [Starkeya nomas]|nr:nitrilase family protein [Starkeya nomas]
MQEKPPEALVRVACLQFEPKIGQKEANIARSVARIEAAAAGGARLIVLPELCNSGYVFNERAEAHDLAEELPAGPSCAAWIEVAHRLGLHIVAGIAERDGAALYNSAAVIGPEGFLGTYRKNHLWGEENLFFEPGDLGIPVWRTPLGRIAVAICYDGWFPETYRLAALQGAEILCVPTNWVPMPEQPVNLPVMANILAMSGAHSNGMFVAAADRVGNERGQPFLGCSLIVDSTGWPLAGPASATEEQVLMVDLNLADARRKRALNTFNHPLRDRRTDMYGEMLGSDARRSWY